MRPAELGQDPSRRPAAGLSPIPIEQASVFLDLDGTLVPMSESPGDAGPDPSRTAILRAASERLSGRIAVVSGRTIARVDSIIERACLAVAGVHGLQRRTAAGQLESVEAHPRVQHAAEVMAAFAQGHPGLLVEPKHQSVALHYRGAPTARAAVMEFVGRLAQTERLVLQPGHMVMELRTPGPDKGAAVRAFLGELPFRESRPIFLGDDLTDESAFEEVARQGGVGILVGPWRPTAATSGLDDPAGVLAWLSAGLAAGAFEVPALSPVLR